MISLMPYIGGKHRMAGEIAKRLHATGADTLVDVFGGSSAVLLNAGFQKRVYNDASGDLVNLFRCLGNPSNRIALFRRLKCTPPSRKIFNDDAAVYVNGLLSFANVSDQVERARMTLYRQLLAWGGKGRSGGFSASCGDRTSIKEVLRYQNVLRKLVKIGHYFQGTIIENLDYQNIIRTYGRKPNVVLFCDPPYVGTECYYSHIFGRADHAFLAHQLSNVSAQAVLTYYDLPLIRELYPESSWKWENIVCTKNSQLRKGNKPKTNECIITKRRCL